MSTELPDWDESLRPLGTGFPDATDGQRQRGDHLRLIHDMYRRGLAQVAEVLDQVGSGQITVGDARAAVHALGLQVSYEQLGSFCGQLCRSIETHHQIEDIHLYPALRAADDDLHPVIDRLDLEHDVIHQVLVILDESLVAMARAGTDPHLGVVRRQFAHLRRLLESHFVYEEQQIGTALAVHNVSI